MRNPTVRHRIFNDRTAAALAALSLFTFGGCATTGAPPKGELRYAQRFCQAHAMIGVVREVDVALATKWSDFDDFSIGANRTDALTMQKRLQQYTTRWQHLHQALNLACRDFASCRFRADSAVAVECDPLRRRLDEVTETGRVFLIELQRVAGDGAFFGDGYGD